MKSSNLLICLLIIALATVCGGGNSSDAATKTLVSVAATPTNPSIVLGTTTRFTATGTYSDNTTTNLTTSVPATVRFSSTSGVPASTNLSTTQNAPNQTSPITVSLSGTGVTATPGSWDWIAITSGWNGVGSEPVNYMVLPNNTGSSRSGYLTIAGQTFTITQQAQQGACTYSILPTSNSFGSGAGSGNVNVITSSGCSWTASTDSGSWDWIGISSGWSGTGNGTVNYFVLANNAGIPRTGILRIAGQTFTVTQTGSEAKNVLSITVNGSLCAANSYPNKPCVSVTVCTPGTSTCQTINDILLDTGSYGLRIFQQVLSVSLVQATSDSGSLAECIQFGDGSSWWGPVQIADVILGSEPAVRVPIQVVESTFGTIPSTSACRNADRSPADAGLNGILGAGLLTQDCGSACTSSINNGIYYSCSGSICTGTRVPLSNQVQNPVSLLPQDNNGVIVQLPSIPADGLPSVDGNLVLGIGTQSNNVPSGVTAYPANQVGQITTDLNGNTYSSFIDSGSNGFFFTPPSTSPIPNCPAPASAWFCPSSTMDLSATISGASGSPSGVISFQIGNFDSLTNSFNSVFDDIGGTAVNVFDWGLPFFFGRNIYIGFEGGVSSLGSGPYFAY